MTNISRTFHDHLTNISPSFHVHFTYISRICHVEVPAFSRSSCRLRRLRNDTWDGTVMVPRWCSDGAVMAPCQETITITVPSQAPSLCHHCTITAPSRHHHGTITAPSRHHHGTITVTARLIVHQMYQECVRQRQVVCAALTLQ